jgi:hypothetical protein
MADETERNEHTVSTRVMELVIAALFMATAVLIMYDNWRIGASWGESGPEAGYFPFRVGAIMFIASAVTFGVNFLAKTPSSSFVERSQLQLVLKVLIPTAVFVVAIGFVGIYVAAAVFITFFMWWLGKYPLYKILPVAILVPIALFFMFEIWFLVPLPKGPIEYALGY